MAAPVPDTLGSVTTLKIDPPTFGEEVIQDDLLDLNFMTTCVWVAGAGDIRVTLMGMPDDTSILFTGVPAGYFVARIKRIWDTDTTATGMIAMTSG